MSANAPWQTPAHDPEGCPGCRPICFDPRTLAALPASHPAQQAADRTWATATPAERVAWHRVTCLASRHPTDRALAEALVARMTTR